MCIYTLRSQIMSDLFKMMHLPFLTLCSLTEICKLQCSKNIVGVKTLLGVQFSFTVIAVLVTTVEVHFIYFIYACIKILLPTNLSSNRLE